MDTIELASSLISFDTVSPPGNEEPCARFIEDYLRDLRIPGASVELHSFASGRANLVATVPGDSPGLLLSGHIDVVPPGDAQGWASPAFEGSVREGKLFGRGAADMKGGLAAILDAVSSVKGRRLKRSIVVVATAGEEVGFDGLEALIGSGRLKGVPAVYGVVGEPTEMKVVRGHRGGVTARVTFEGRSAHASDPSLGVNSIEKAVAFINALRPLRTELGSMTDPDLGRTILTPTVIRGGTKSNVIPGSCELTIDSRTLPVHGTETILNGLKSVVLELRKKDPEFGAEVVLDYSYGALLIPAGHEVVRLAEEASGSQASMAPYGTEAPLYTAIGIPTVVLGPGSVRQAHVYDEYVTIEQLLSARTVYAKLIEQFCA